MAPLIPRVHLFEIDDQPWFPPSLRVIVQAILTKTWSMNLPIPSRSPAQIAASKLIQHLDSSLSSLRFVDFCAGAGGPSPLIERQVNTYLRNSNREEVDFVLTDIHPNIDAWARIASQSPRITYDSQSVDASRVPKRLTQSKDGRDVFRLFNLAFHHFDDDLARRILKDAVERKQGFAIFELQDRSALSFMADLLLPIGVILSAPYYASKWRAPSVFIFTWLIPVIPLVLIWDGIVSSLRTRDPGEVEALLRSCGGDATGWEMRSGKETFLWPCGHLNWIICQPVKK
ncbi:hypothetical protein B0J15DRAFT_511760 [Fusarium solani]|uniref:Uncharacterized protein n=1 Tax=Fusarium solani TaxID=169388 RepID=A0A9P9HMZ8_FUSSL|nr:uncharacterized protein B0J15DRAFT_511760 [Fusarium solani]KAH7259928.1 hypothetical protein B0J15DRAFT_511760 [Fusarium solani]